jgi:aldehyde:ferredoxin oxidoreductase
MGQGDFGGFFGPELKFAGYDHIIVKGIAEDPVYIWIDDDDVEIRDATHIWGKTTWETDKILKDEIGDGEIKACYVGPAGENLVAASPIISELSYSGGRTDCGVIMGAKKLKAIAVRGSGAVKVARPYEFEKEYMRFYEMLDLMQCPDANLLPNTIFGNLKDIRISNSIFELQTYNAQKMRFEYIDDIDEKEILEKYIAKQDACFCCFLPCKKWFVVQDGLYAGTRGGGLQAGFGVFTHLLGVNEPSSALKAWSLCNQLGVDVFFAGYAIAWAMECFQRRILTANDTDGIELTWGKHKAVIEMIKKIAYKDGFGAILAQGVDEASRKIGKGSEKFALTIKGRELDNMPLRNLYVAALGVAVSETGPDHTRWTPPYLLPPSVVPHGLLEELNLDIDLKKAFQKRLPEGKGRLLKFLEDTRALIESISCCVFFLRGVLTIDFRLWKNMLEAATGVDFTYPEFIATGERIRNVERSFIVREGFRRKDDMIPRRMREEPIPDSPYGPLKIEDFDAMLDEYYEVRGWDKKTAIPTREKLENLGLKEIADEFNRLGIK